MPIREVWRDWFGEFLRSVNSLELDKVDLYDTERAEKKSAALALLARLLSETQSALVLVDAGRDLAFRSTCRSAIECSLHLFLAETEDGYIDLLRSDDEVSRRSRAKKFMANGAGKLAKEAEKHLQEFLRRSAGAKGKFQISDIQTPFPRQTHVYREISADSAHVTWTSLVRHLQEIRPGWIELKIEPSVTESELEEAASILAFSLLSGMRSLLNLVPVLEDKCNLEAIFEAYKTIYLSGKPKVVQK
ncbi:MULTISPECIES: hypothetical protein [unclassified Mesorhizobium]|uniref:hypothetical protein n=1 Tax=unclassified Mesorhizobium TaxID=325217 RepID=UPI00112E8CFC|nr:MULTISPECIES: hypothetical protein [unclassified Mesorhizobium]MBZ9698187.1 hypothetical protein [Mesorhizobium sp. CO1-1-9]TPK17102.1 hypothetical protein FJ543_00790 [Mesorhizobium sp. B2-5-7]